jgi:uncharacterized protein
MKKFATKFKRRNIMDLEAAKNLLTEWAKSKPCITKMWLYGSRIKGTYLDDSDLDIAIEFHFDDGNESFLSQMIHALHKYRKGLKSLLNVTPHLEYYGGAEETPHIHRYITTESRLIYTKVL